MPCCSLRSVWSLRSLNASMGWCGEKTASMSFAPSRSVVSPDFSFTRATRAEMATTVTRGNDGGVVVGGTDLLSLSDANLAIVVKAIGLGKLEWWVHTHRDAVEADAVLV